MNSRLRRVMIALLLVLTGSVLTLFVERVIMPPRAAASATAPHTSLVAQMGSTLRLTPAQRDSVHTIFARHQSAVDTAWHSITRRMHATMDSVHHELEQVLDAEQIAAFRDLVHGRRSRHHFRH